MTDKSQDFGDVNANSVKEIWNNDEYQTARGLFQDSYVPNKWVGCLSCSVYLGSTAANKRGEVNLQEQPLEIVINGTKVSNGRTPARTQEPAQETSIIVEAPEESIKR